VGISAWVGDKRFEIGDPSFLKSWLSTISVRLEQEDWGSLFPVIMRHFYSGSVPYDRAGDALTELESIRQRLSACPPERVVWDFENRDAPPPWSEDINAHIVSLGNYFVTSDGKDLFDVLVNAFSESAKSKRDVVISREL
jgi:Immunity protein 70